MMQTQLYLAPIQGITDYTFRNSFCRHFSGIDKVYAPFVRFQQGFEIKKSQGIDLLPLNNSSDNFVPQILSTNSGEILYFAQYIKQLGYTGLNWNLGCPFPMVTNRHLGAGMLPFPDTIDKILDEVFSEISVELSVKMRLGMNNDSESIPVLQVLNKYPIHEIIIHPRIGKQMYKGTVDLDSFSKCLEISKHKICYNGDIKCFDDYKKIKERFNDIMAFMLGRGLISNPFLAEEIMQENQLDPETKLERFGLFHSSLFESYQNILSGPGHLLTKMLQLWEYFSFAFEEQHKVYKMIKKASSIEKYQNSVYEIFNNKTFVL